MHLSGRHLPGSYDAAGSGSSLPLGASASHLFISPPIEVGEFLLILVKYVLLLRGGCKWFADSAKIWNRSRLFEAVWSGNAEIITEEMAKLLRKTISYHDYKEDFYHAFLAEIFTGAGYTVDSNKEHGEGRSDVVIYDDTNGRVAIFEAKYSKTSDRMEMDCDRAIDQINDRMYADEYADEYETVLCYGIAFYKKRCRVKKK